MSKLRQEKLQRKLQSPGLVGSLQLKFEVFKRVFGDNERRVARQRKTFCPIPGERRVHHGIKMSCHLPEMRTRITLVKAMPGFIQGTTTTVAF